MYVHVSMDVCMCMYEYMNVCIEYQSLNTANMHCKYVCITTLHFICQIIMIIMVLMMLVAIRKEGRSRLTGKRRRRRRRRSRKREGSNSYILLQNIPNQNSAHQMNHYQRMRMQYQSKVMRI